MAKKSIFCGSVCVEVCYKKTTLHTHFCILTVSPCTVRHAAHVQMWESDVYVISSLLGDHFGLTLFLKALAGPAQHQFIILKARLHQRHLL